jgi:GxxExxY protein
LINHGEHGEHGEKPAKDCGDDLIGAVINAAIAVHRILGPGLLESVYEQALAFELADRNIKYLRQVDVPVVYKGYALGIGFRADMIVEEGLLLELKTVDSFSPVHLAQVITYLRLLNIKRGLLLNFNTKLLKDGIKRVSI